MNKNQIAQIYDKFPKEQQNMSRSEFIKKAMAVLDSNKMMQEVNAIVQGRIRRKQIDAALGK